ncbi:MAG: META domain-containing protein [Candidatus Hermodarchaeota archaeon]|nr:META domain-containing protein [Candidatus Hermodarchaeota archaeon]
MSKMRLMFLLGLIVLTVGLVIATTIGIDSCESPSVGLEGTWVLKCYGEPGKLKLPYPAIRSPTWKYCGDITLTFGASDQISTCASVNRCSGKYEVDGNKLSIGHGWGSLPCVRWMFGPKHLMEQEFQYITILTSAQTYEITNCMLIISSGKGVLVFTRKE